MADTVAAIRKLTSSSQMNCHFKENAVMFRKSVMVCSVTFLLLAFLGGCTSVTNITHRSQLANSVKTGEIKVLTKDGTRYRLTNYQVTDSLLSGTGLVERNGVREYHLEILRLSDIKYIRTENNVGIGTALVAAGATVFFTATALSYLEGSDGFSVSEAYKYYSPNGGGGGGTSCPYIYSWNGKRYVLDAEAFGVALGKGLEMTTRSSLTSLREENGLLRIQIANERPETHFVNAVHLLSAEVDTGAEVVVGPDNALLRIGHPDPPVSASDRSGNTILPAIRDVDGSFWESGEEGADAVKDFEDVIDVRFVRPAGKGAGTFLLTGINTEFSNVVYRNVCRFLGDQAQTFMQRLDGDSDLVGIIREWIDGSSMKVSVWTGTNWDNAGAILPEATNVPFTRAIPINIHQLSGDTVLVRIRCLKDVWKLDALRMDWTSACPLETSPVSMVSAVGSGDGDVLESLRRADTNYVVLLPLDKVNLTFKSVPSAKGKKIVYAIDVRGYLHEWVPEDNDRHGFAWTGFIPENQRMNCLKSLLHDKSIFLPSIYAEWGAVKKHYSVRDPE